MGWKDFSTGRQERALGGTEKKRERRRPSGERRKRGYLETKNMEEHEDRTLWREQFSFYLQRHQKIQ